VDYAYAAEAGQDFGAPKKQDKLDSQDDTPPTRPVVDAAPTTKSTSVLYASWQSLDYESGVQEYQYRLAVKGPSIEPLTGWYSAGGQTEVNVQLDQPMQPGTSYHIQVRARNGAGIWSEVGTSSGTQLNDPSPPTHTVLRRAIVVTDTLRVSWFSASDPESGVMGYRYAVGTRPYDADVLSWTDTQNTQFAVALELVRGAFGEKISGKTTAYVTVCAVNGLGVEGPAVGQAVPLTLPADKKEL
jgi:hypothetical protein